MADPNTYPEYPRAQVILSRIGSSEPNLDQVNRIPGPDGSVGVPAADILRIAARLGVGDVVWFPQDIVPVPPNVDETVAEGDTPILSIAGESAYIDMASCQLFVDGEASQPPYIEFKLLGFFAKRPKIVLTRNIIQAQVWGDTYSHSRTVDCHVRRIRDRLGPYRRVITTVRGIGYRFDPIED